MTTGLILPYFKGDRIIFDNILQSWWSKHDTFGLTGKDKPVDVQNLYDLRSFNLFVK